MKKASLVQRDWFVVLMLIICFPVGLYLMWKQRKWDKATRIAVTISWFIYCGFVVYVYKSVVNYIKIDNLQALMLFIQKSLPYDFWSVVGRGSFIIQSIMLFISVFSMLGLYLMWHNRKVLKWSVSICCGITFFVSLLILYVFGGWVFIAFFAKTTHW